MDFSASDHVAPQGLGCVVKASPGGMLTLKEMDEIPTCAARDAANQHVDGRVQPDSGLAY